MKCQIKFIVEEPIKITLYEVATDLISYLSKDTQALVYLCICNSADYIFEHFNNFPQGIFFEYSIPIHGGIVFGYAAFWDRRENKNFVVVTTFSFHRPCDRKIPDEKIKMINGFIDDYFQNN